MAPSTKVLRARVATFPVRMQDGTGIERVLLAAIEEALDELAGDVALLDTEIDRAAIQSAELELPAGQHGGSLVLAGDFGAAAIGSPVLMTQAPGEPFDEAEFGIVSFVAAVVSASQMRIAWSAPSGAPRRVQISYLVGTTGKDI